MNNKKLIVNELNIWIQENYPMFLTDEVSLFAILKKIVCYVNSLILREKELKIILDDLKKYETEEFLKLNEKLTTTINELNKIITTFISDLNKEFDNLEVNVNLKINEQNNKINVFITNINTQYNAFTASINEEITAINNRVDAEIRLKEQSVDETLANINVESQVESYFNTQLNTDYFKKLYDDSVKICYCLAYYGATLPTKRLYQAYYYDTTSDTLYYQNTKADIIKGCLYFFDGHIYVGVEETEKIVLREVRAV